MTINQLFKNKPSPELFLNILELYNLTGFNDTKSFTKKDLVVFETVKRLEEHIQLLEGFYLPCKAKIYLKNLNEKKSITILRQLLKLFKYNLKSTEKYIQGEKMIEYNIYCMFKKDEQTGEDKCVISFD